MVNSMNDTFLRFLIVAADLAWITFMVDSFRNGVSKKNKKYIMVLCLDLICSGRQQKKKKKKDSEMKKEKEKKLEEIGRNK